MAFLSTVIARSIPFIPKPVVGYFAKPYIAGESLADGVRVVKDLNARGIMATMDVLGESVSTREESLDMRRQCEEVLHTIHREKLDSNLSIKPTQMGLTLDTDFCEENVRVLCEIAKGYGNFVRIDMEDHPTTDATLRMYRNLRRDFRGHVGTVIQSYMRRSENDITTLLDEDETNLRLCKGIYVEPESVAFKGREEVRENYKALLRLILRRGGYPGIATHDDPLLQDALALVKELGLPASAYEFQMLLGVRPQTRDAIVAAGHRMRVYVPFGKQWYAYSTRRLKENPNVAMHIVKAILGLNK
ncbi:MAG: proline dehydrogenase family protein [Ignavibacteriae bacterium]|nr:proline dehydrogenase family protein [Ignavibacteriota bacterium]